MTVNKLAGCLALVLAAGCAAPAEDDSGNGGAAGTDSAAAVDSGSGSSSGGEDAGTSAAKDTGPAEPVDGAPCDDGEPCTLGDHYKDGKCVGGADLCQCRKTADCGLFEDGNKCNGTLICSTAKVPYACVVDPSTRVDCTDANDTACTRNACDTMTGKCAMKATPAGTPCVDEDPCTVDASCKGGKCVGGAASQCACKQDKDCAKFEDGNACTGTLYCDKTLFPYSCKTNLGTVTKCKPPEPGKPCLADACDTGTGKCASTPVEKVYSPAKAGDGATHAPLMIATAKLAANLDTGCDDNDSCTSGEKCLAGTCDSTEKAGATDTCKCSKNADCKGQEDGNLCNGTLYCDLKTEECKINPVSLVTCKTVSDTACVKNVCQPLTGLCQLTPVAPGGKCEDGDACTIDTYCKQGACVGGKNTCSCKVDADCAGKGTGDLCDGKLFCNKAAGVCEKNPAKAKKCKTGDDTTCAKNVCIPKTGECEARARQEVTRVCDKLPNGQENPNSCTWKLQPPGHSKIEDLSCNDGNQCTTGDACLGKDCKPGVKTCECFEDADCYKNDDGNLCNGAPYCDRTSGKGVCKMNKVPKVCPGAENTACIVNTCNPATGACYLAPRNEGKACAVADKCLGNAVCKAAKCVGKPLDCDDKNACTVDVCKAAVGCVHTAKEVR